MTTFEWVITFAFVVVIATLWIILGSLQEILRGIERNTSNIDGTLDDILRQLGGGEEGS